MKNSHFRLVLVLIAASGLVLTSCKKTDTANDLSSAQDENTATQHMNAVMDDAGNAAGGSSSLSGKTDGLYTLVGATIDSSQAASGILTITYDGTTIVDNKFKRSGTVTLTLEGYTSGTRWRDQGAVLDAQFTALVITNIATGGHVQYDGLNKLTNVTGGLAWRLLAGLDNGTVVHRHTATSVQLTFDDGSQRTWSVDRSRTYTRTSAGALSLTLSGNATQGGHTNVDMWGTNRKGADFVNEITTPIVFDNSCSSYRNPDSGEMKHYVNGNTLDVLFGVDATGNVTTSCPYGYKVTYTTSRNRTYTAVFQYWH
ncbi:MAG: hypothetical protein JST76_09250 [Bacteroidetes bacterium]|nr:hypothetical protein [Bacteroidota bacterium]